MSKKFGHLGYRIFKREIVFHKILFLIVFSFTHLFLQLIIAHIIHNATRTIQKCLYYILKKCLIRLFLAQINLMNQEVEIHNTRMMCQDVM